MKDFIGWPQYVVWINQDGSVPTAQDYIDDLGIPELNVGGNYNDGIYWKPSNPADLTSPPVFTTEADHFSAFQRAGTKWEPNAQGIYVPYANSVPAFKWENGRRRLSLEAASTRLTAYPATPMANWNTTGGTKAAYAGTYLGVFSNAAEVFSQGQVWHRALIPYAGALNSGSVVSWTAYYRSGSSGLCRIMLRNETALTDSNIAGTPGNLSVTSTGAGAVTISEQYQAADGTYVVRGTWTLNAASTNISLGVTPNTTTVGGSVIVLGGFIETSPFPTSPIFSSPSTSVTRPADNDILSPAHEAVLQSAAATALVRGGNVKNLASANIMGGDTRLIGGNAAGTAIALGNATDITLGAASAPISSFGVAGAWDASGKAGSYNGAATVTDGVALDTNLTQVYLGRSQGGAIMNFSADLCAAAPARLSDARLQELAVTA